jgi:hypothetical protein
MDKCYVSSCTDGYGAVMPFSVLKVGRQVERVALVQSALDRLRSVDLDIFLASR